MLKVPKQTSWIGLPPFSFELQSCSLCYLGRYFDIVDAMAELLCADSDGEDGHVAVGMASAGPAYHSDFIEYLFGYSGEALVFLVFALVEGWLLIKEGGLENDR